MANTVDVYVCVCVVGCHEMGGSVRKCRSRQRVVKPG